jgi:hypothetical protein
MRSVVICFVSVFMIGVLSNSAMAQCVISTHAQPGFYPTTLEGIHPSADGDHYILNVTIKIPKDTVISPYPRLNIDSATVKAFIGFPSSFQFEYNTPSQWLRGDSSGCILIHGVPGTADVGIHGIDLVFSAMIMGFAITDTIFDYWQFEIKDATHVGIELPEAQDNIATMYPNPAGNHLDVTVSIGGMTTIALFNTAGKMVLNQEQELISGETTRLKLDGLRSGIYFLKIETVAGIVTQKVTVIR